MGATHFLTRTLDRVSTEMSLHVLAYNLKRVLNLLGSGALMAAMKAWGLFYEACPPQQACRSRKCPYNQNHRLRLIGPPTASWTLRRFPGS